MLRPQLEHVIRASADVADDDDIVVVGSQAVLGQASQVPSSMLVSVEADVYPRAHPERADVIEGAIGEGSPFHATFGYYAHGVGPATAKAPAGWEARLVPLRTANTRGATGWCLEPHDLVLAKCVAGRGKDWRFAQDAVESGLVRFEALLARLPGLPVDAALIAEVERGLRRLPPRR